MRNKIIMITAMLAVMVAMTGIAAANPYDAFIYVADGSAAAPQPLLIPNGGNVDLSYRGENIVNAAINKDLKYNYSVVAFGGGVVGDITVTFTHANFHPTAKNFTDVGVVNIARSASAPAGATYRVTIKAGDEAADVDFGAASRNLEVPEFPTVALPIAAVIGLVFLFQNKKKKE
jgi:hypothetical protein